MFADAGIGGIWFEFMLMSFFKPEDLPPLFPYDGEIAFQICKVINAKRDTELERMREALEEASKIVRHYANATSAWKHEGTLEDFDRFFEKYRLPSWEWLSKYGQDK